MQDKLLEILGNVTDLAAKFEQQELEIAPILADIQNNSENVDPKLMEMYDKEMKNLGAMKANLSSVKENLKNFKA